MKVLILCLFSLLCAAEVADAACRGGGRLFGGRIFSGRLLRGGCR